MVAPLRRVLVRPPDEAFGRADPERWHYRAAPDLAAARAEHAALVDLLAGAGAEVLVHDVAIEDRADSIYVHDPVLVTNRGTIVLRMGKELRRGEEEAAAEALERVGVPVLGRLQGDACAEGGDLLWLDPETLAVGQGFRTNQAGLDQLAALLDPLGVRCVPVPLPVYEGEAACLHLMSLISMVADDLAVAYEPLLPVPFWRLLRERGIELLRVPDEEFASQGPNVLALAPRQCVLLEDNVRTAAALRAAGCEVLGYRGREISHKCEGGATCLTRPVWRAT